MKFVECVVCKKKSIKFSYKNENLIIDLHEDWDLIYKYHCNNCDQTTIKIKQKNTDKINSLWLEYFFKNKSIQKKIINIEKEIEILNKTRKKSASVRKKFYQLNKSFEDSKIKKESLKHSMLASISIQLGTLL